MPEIREVVFPPDVEEKLWLEHQLTQAEVERVIFDEGSEPRWDIDPQHGGRVVIRGYVDTSPLKLVFVALRPIDLARGVWACITAFVPTRDDYG